MAGVDIKSLLAQLQQRVESKAKSVSATRAVRKPKDPTESVAAALKREYRSILEQIGGYKKKRHPNLLYKRPVGEGAIAKAWTVAIELVTADPAITKAVLAEQIIAHTGIAKTSSLDVAYKVRRFLNLVEEGFFTQAGEVSPSAAAEIKEFNRQEAEKAAAFVPSGDVDIEALKARLDAVAAQGSLDVGDYAEAEDDAEDEDDLDEVDDEDSSYEE
jgi:hypothetical protein